MFIMQSRESKYPLNVLSLVSTKPDYDSNTRTISLTVVRFQIARECSPPTSEHLHHHPVLMVWRCIPVGGNDAFMAALIVPDV